MSDTRPSRAEDLAEVSDALAVTADLASPLFKDLAVRLIGRWVRTPEAPNGVLLTVVHEIQDIEGNGHAALDEPGRSLTSVLAQSLGDLHANADHFGEDAEPILRAAHRLVIDQLAWESRVR